MSDILHNMLHDTQPNIFGGEDFSDTTGAKIGFSIHNIFGGDDIYDSAGIKVAHTLDNPFGGHDLDVGMQKILSTSHSPLGEQVTDAANKLLGGIHQTPDGFTIQDAIGGYSTWHDNIFGGHTLDPLSNMAELDFPSLL